MLLVVNSTTQNNGKTNCPMWNVNSMLKSKPIPIKLYIKKKKILMKCFVRGKAGSSSISEKDSWLFCLWSSPLLTYILNKSWSLSLNGLLWNSFSYKAKNPVSEDPEALSLRVSACPASLISDKWRKLDIAYLLFKIHK